MRREAWTDGGMFELGPWWALGRRSFLTGRQIHMFLPCCQGLYRTSFENNSCCKKYLHFGLKVQARKGLPQRESSEDLAGVPSILLWEAPWMCQPGPVSITSCPQHSSCCSKCQNFLFESWVIVHCIGRSILCHRTLGLLPPVAVVKNAAVSRAVPYLFKPLPSGC